MPLAGTLPFSTPTEDPGASNDVWGLFSFLFLFWKKKEESVLLKQESGKRWGLSSGGGLGSVLSLVEGWAQKADNWL